MAYIKCIIICLNSAQETAAVCSNCNAQTKLHNLNYARENMR